jgi:L-threonylcarbamoyladenylate synthase
VSPTTAAHVRAEFGDELFILDGGPCQAGIESTVVTLVETPARVLRPGVVSALAISKILGEGVIDARSGDVALPDQPAAAPGLHERHYATRARAILFDRNDWARIAADATGSLCVLAISDLAPAANARIIAMPANAVEYAHALYGALRSADESSPSLIAIERPPSVAPTEEEASLWATIADRLARATSP